MSEQWVGEQVKRIPELKYLQPEQYASWLQQYASWLRKATDPEWNEEKFGTSTRSKPERAAASLALELHDAFERIARSEQALAALEARNRELESALGAIRAYHVELNRLRNRHIECSKTVALCDAALKGAS